MPRRNYDPRRRVLREQARRRFLEEHYEEQAPTYHEMALTLVRAGKASPAILGPLRFGYHHHSPKENAA